MISGIVIVILIVLLWSSHTTNNYNLKVIEDNDRIYRRHIAKLDEQLKERKEK